VFIIDEADHLLDEANSSNAVDTLKVMRPSLPDNTQYLLFSATFEDRHMQAIANIGTQYKEIRVAKEQLALPNIKQYYITCEKTGKIDKLIEIIQSVPTNKLTIVFVNTVRFAEVVSRKIKEVLDE
jgi:ATP-dependent RNA helicase DeaD